jgi:solute:Na+ symporter, SSS family
MPHVDLKWVDISIMVVYVLFVLGIGWVLKRMMKTSTDFFLSGRSIPAWICGLAFISANLGAQEVIGMGASGAKYGILTSHFYWVGAIPAMVFVGIFMMPYYYGSRARSVPEYLRLRFDEKTRGLNAISFAFMTVMSSGVSMHAMGELSSVLFGDKVFGFDCYTFSITVSAIIILFYIFAGGLTSAIYNEVLQFFLIVFGFIPLVYLGLKNVGWWTGLKERLAQVAQQTPGLAPDAYTSSWAHMTDPAKNPMGIEWFGLVMGLGFVLSFGYWCTDFLVVQRAMAANSMVSARRTPLIAAIPKMFFPFLVIIPGMIALVAGPKALAPSTDDPAAVAEAGAAPSNLDFSSIIPLKEDPETHKMVYNYDRATPMMLVHYFPAGLLGLGLTALLASFMSGMAGNVTALNTVWTYDIYQSYINRTASDQHYLWMGRFATVAGIILSVGAAFLANKFNNIMDLLQLVFAFVNAPLFATFALGMFWRRTTGHGAFYGLLAGTAAAAVQHGLSLPAGAEWGFKGGYLKFLGYTHIYANEMAQNFWKAIFAFTVCFVVSIVISMFTKPRPAEELKGLVYSLTPKADEGDMPWYKRPAALAILVLLMTLALNLIFY